MPSSVISSAQSQVTLRRVVKAGRSSVVQRAQFANCAAYATMGFNKQQISTGMSSRSQIVMVRGTLHSSWCPGGGGGFSAWEALSPDGSFWVDCIVD